MYVVKTEKNARLRTTASVCILCQT